MKILAIPDIHGDTKRLERLSDRMKAADIILLVGDITHFGREKDIKGIVERVQGSNPHVLAVTGNCDFPEVGAYLTDVGLSIEAKCRRIGGLGFAGLGASLHSPSRSTPNEVSDEHLKKKLDSAAREIPQNGNWVLVSHQPPAQTSADRLLNGRHVGSASVRRFIETHQPLVCFTGHIHEGVGIDTIEATQVVNPGPFFKGNYVYAEIDGTVKVLKILNID